jgi:hypothetical protein
MKIERNNIDFTSFKDGICDIYTTDEGGNEVLIHSGIRFENRVIGYKRFWAAASNKVQANKLIRIPILNNSDSYCTVEIKGIGKFDVKMAQDITDSNPPCIELTLQRV